jgi:hypothetical protein
LASAGSTFGTLRGFVLAPAQRACAFGRTHRHPPAHDLAGEAPPALVVGDGKHRARVPLGQVAALDEAEHVVGKLEQAQPVRHGRLRLAHPLGESPRESSNSSN